jgi:small subunit ribosomal protein S8e
MAHWHGKSRRKKTGGRNVLARGKRRTEISTEKQWAFVGDSKRKNYRKTGGNPLTRVLGENCVSVADKKTGKVFKAKIQTVLDNPCDPNYVRRNILTKGAVIETDKGTVKITSRPGKDGVINGILVE